jgi:hypothetical protein
VPNFSSLLGRGASAWEPISAALARVQKGDPDKRTELVELRECIFYDDRNWRHRRQMMGDVCVDDLIHGEAFELRDFERDGYDAFVIT